MRDPLPCDNANVDEQRNLPVGIFDSGVGGLTVMRGIADLLPDESLTYLGDTARVPYGNRGANTVRRYAVNAATMLRGEGIKALVVACNTASAYALDDLRRRLDVPVVDVVEPVARRAAESTTSGVVGVIGTRGTVSSGCYRRTLERLQTARVVQAPCPLFVPLAEEGWLDGGVVDEVARSYLASFAGTDLDVLILGCTHYPLLRRAIQRVIDDVMQRPVTLLDSASATAEALRETLDRAGLGATGVSPRLRFCATDDPDSFRSSAELFFGDVLTNVEHVDILDVTTSSEGSLW